MKYIPSLTIIWAFVFIITFAHSRLAHASGDSGCLFKPQPGLCRASFQRWFYDSFENKCSVFTWGGCGGVVPFETEKECESAMCSQNKCALKPVIGPCRARISKWFYDNTHGKCMEFKWGGCKGVVPFHTEWECVEARCNPACTQYPETGRCKAIVTKYFFNQIAGKCDTFVWGGCHGVVPFETLQKCEQAKCLPLYPPSNSPTPTPSLTPSPSPSASVVSADIPPVCLLKPDPGFCLAYFPSWYWDNNLKQCKKFIWGGCGGVVPFKTLHDCEIAGCYTKDKCTIRKADVQHTTGSVTCQAIWTSWYFNKTTHECKSFSYSGCSNIGPFEREEDCLQQCA